MNRKTLILAAVCAGVFLAGSASSAQAQDYSLVNSSGGEMGATAQASGEYTEWKSQPHCPNGGFFISRRELRYDAHFSSNTKLVRASDRAGLCSW